MKRIIIPAITLALLLQPTGVMAQPVINNVDPESFTGLKVIDIPLPQFLVPVVAQPEPPKKPEPQKPIVYKVRRGDTLTEIGAKHRIAWQRIWAKNKQLKHPDRLTVGQKLTMPLPGEKVRRKLPRAVTLPAATPGVSSPSQAASTFAPTMFKGSVAGNTYSYGYCTWYVKNRRPDLPNNLGNADTWYSRAQAQGIPTGTTPRAGAVGMTKAYGHVVYIESVNSNGTVNVAEMNYSGWNVESRRTAPASEFLYIY